MSTRCVCCLSTRPTLQSQRCVVILFNSSSHANDSPLQVIHAAALGGLASVVQLLLEAGADPSAQNGAGETVLSLAVLVGQWECAEALVMSTGGVGALQVLYDSC